MEQFNKKFLTFLAISLFSLIAIQTGLGLYRQTSNILGLQDIGETVRPSSVCKTGVKSIRFSTLCGVDRFRYISFQCYDNSAFKEGDPSSCKTSADWKSYAAYKCAGKSNCSPKPSQIPTPTPKEKTIPCYQLSAVYKQTCPIDSDTVHPACGKINSLLSIYCKSADIVSPGPSIPAPPTTPILTTTPTPSISSTIYVTVYWHPGTQDQKVYNAPVKLTDKTTGRQLGFGFTNQNGESPRWQVPTNTNFEVTVYKPRDWATNYCGSKWSGNTGPYGTWQVQNMRLYDPSTTPCILE